MFPFWFFCTGVGVIRVNLSQQMKWCTCWAGRARSICSRWMLLATSGRFSAPCWTVVFWRWAFSAWRNSCEILSHLVNMLHMYSCEALVSVHKGHQVRFAGKLQAKLETATLLLVQPQFAFCVSTHWQQPFPSICLRFERVAPCVNRAKFKLEEHWMQAFCVGLFVIVFEFGEDDCLEQDTFLEWRALIGGITTSHNIALNWQIADCLVCRHYFSSSVDCVG